MDTLLLPVFNRFETPHRTTVESGNNWVRLNEPGTTHLRGTANGGEPTDWRRLQDPVYVRELIARTVPGYEAMAGIDASKREFEVRGRVFHTPRFPTATGERGLMLSLITARSYGQHNTVVYEQGDSYRGMPHRHTLLINPQDLVANGLVAHQRVPVLVRGPVDP